MPRPNRNISWRTILPPLALAIFLLTIFPMGARAAAGDANPFVAPAREFARRVAASFPPGTRVAIEVRNRSSLGAGDVAAVRETILGELAARDLRVTTTAESADVAASATITLSENTNGFLWVAEIRQGDRSSVLLMAVPRASAASTAENSGITLRGALLWSGPEHVLAASTAPPTQLAASSATQLANSPTATGASNLLLLITDGVTASVTDARHTFKIALPPSGSVDRDAQGSLAWTASGVTASIDGESCTLSLPLATSQPQCHTDAKVIPSPLPKAQLGSQRADLPAACGGVSAEILASGTGDYTQPDSIRAYEMRDGDVVPVSPAIAFPGPVLSLQTQSNTAAVAVVHNLGTGDDEVYEISLVCGH